LIGSQASEAKSKLASTAVNADSQDYDYGFGPEATMLDLKLVHEGKKYTAVTRHGPLFSPRIDIYTSHDPAPKESQWVGAIIQTENGFVFASGHYSAVTERLFKMMQFVAQ
jgi:hypothetical protein